MRKFCIMLCVLALVGTMVVSAAALDTDQPCSLTLHYGREGEVYSGLTVRAYRVADFAPDGSYAVTAQFAPYPVKIQNITDQSQWDEAAKTLVAYIAADGLASTAEVTTNEEGEAKFSGMKAGLYLIPGVELITEAGRFRFQDFFIFLPTPDEDGIYESNVSANPKPGPVAHHDEYTVVLLWDDGGWEDRPKEVPVDIYHNGKYWDTVILNPENGWRYTWTTDPGDGEWTAIPRNIPKEYTVNISDRDNTITIVNTASRTPQHDRPATGDRAPLEVYVAAMCLSGVLLLILGIWCRRKRT